jgi:rSAM/selenodomain-associated transferase 1
MAADQIGPVAIAVLAKAPISGFAKTRLIPVLGADGAARLQAWLIERAVATACAAGIGPVTLWATPDQTHAIFQTLRDRLGVALACQDDGDLGARMLAASMAANGPVLVIGTDSPALTAEHLRMAAAVLRDGSEVVVFPAEDGGYALIGARRPVPALFSDMRWSTAEVMAETRRRLNECGLSWQEPVTLWDVDVPEDLQRLHDTGLGDLMEKSGITTSGSARDP